MSMYREREYQDDESQAVYLLRGLFPTDFAFRLMTTHVILPPGTPERSIAEIDADRAEYCWPYRLIGVPATSTHIFRVHDQTHTLHLRVD